MSEREDHDHLADELQKEADRLEQQSEELKEEIGDVRSDWERKRRDERVPGAPMPEDGDDEEQPPDEES